MVQAQEQVEKVKGWDIFNKPTSWYVHLGIFFVIGFVVGFVLKHFGRYIIFLLVVGSLLLWSLELLNVITINYAAIKGLIGMSSDVTLNGLGTEISTWIHTHVLETVALGLGFIFSWMLM